MTRIQIKKRSSASQNPPLYSYQGPMVSSPEVTITLTAKSIGSGLLLCASRRWNRIARNLFGLGRCWLKVFKDVIRIYKQTYPSCGRVPNTTHPLQLLEFSDVNWAILGDVCWQSHCGLIHQPLLANMGEALIHTFFLDIWYCLVKCLFKSFLHFSLGLSALFSLISGSFCVLEIQSLVINTYEEIFLYG